MNILIIEDDLYLASQIKKAFLSYSFANKIVHKESYNDFLHLSESLSVFDTILLDINLWEDDEKTGFHILSHIRKLDKKIPIIIISSHSEYSYLEEAFARGAHDYVIKPFRTRELQIRIERWFRNYIFSEYFSLHNTLEYHEITYDIRAYEFYYKEKKLWLSKGSKYLLSLMLIHREKLLSHDFLVEKIWWWSDKDYEKNLRIRIMRLKDQLKKSWIDSWIQTVRWEWYILKKISD